MDEPGKRLSRTIWIGVGLVVILIAVAFVLARVEPQSGHASTVTLPVYGTVADFTLTNQSGEPVTLGNLRGHPWLADIIFTRCPGPCTRMTRQMKSLQDSLPVSSQGKFISLTTDPEFDTPKVLQDYGTKFGADPGRWSFLTGTKMQIAALGIDSLKLVAIEKKPEERTEADDLFIHSTMFVLIDKLGRMRGIYETGGEGIEWTNVQPTIVAAVQQLEREP